MYLLWSNGTAADKASVKLYTFTIYNYSAKIMDLIPVKRIADDEIGLYDIVSKTFFTNAGTGSFGGA